MKPTAKEDIFIFLQSHRDKLSEYGVKKLGIFGSFIRNEQSAKSDIDVLVEFENSKLNYKNYINLAYFLEDGLETTIDLVTADSLSPYIGPNILKEVEYVSL